MKRPGGPGPLGPVVSSQKGKGGGKKEGKKDTASERTKEQSSTPVCRGYVLPLQVCSGVG